MKRSKQRTPFQFVLDELMPVRPVAKNVFGFTHVYLDEVLLLSLRDSVKQPQYNGVWLYTQAEHIESLRREFPLPRRYFWRSKRSGHGWVILSAELEAFEEYVFRACELILNGDRRLGRVTRGKLKTNRSFPTSRWENSEKRKRLSTDYADDTDVFEKMYDPTFKKESM